FEVFGRSAVRFSLAARGYDGSADDPSMIPPRIEADGLDLRDWKNRVNPTLNGQAVKLETNEQSRCFAIAPDGQSLVLGTDWNLRRLARSGKEIWKRPAPATVWGVNISGDGRWAVAAYGDGTIRWHRLSDGRELLAFFPHVDRRRWVLWTPSGYYDASPGAEDLIGWHLNRGKDSTADFFPVSRFRGQFNRPDAVARVFETLDEGEALRMANAQSGRRETTQPARLENVLPPVVQILSPGDGSGVSTG